MNRIVSACLVIVLSGCTTFSLAERDKRDAARAEAACRAIGLDQSSKKWADCLIKMMAAKQASAQTQQGAAQSTQSGQQGMSMLCKNAISRGDQGGTFIFC